MLQKFSKWCLQFFCKFWPLPPFFLTVYNYCLMVNFQWNLTPSNCGHPKWMYHTRIFVVVTFTTFTYMFIHPNLFTPAISSTWLSILNIRITNWTLLTILIANTCCFSIKVIDSCTLAFWTILISITARAWLAFYRTKNFFTFATLSINN